MTTVTMRAMMLGLLGTTAMAIPVFAQDASAPAPQDVPAPAASTAGTQALGTTETAPAPKTNAEAATPSDADSTEIVVTATKREENLQDVPVSIQAIGTKRLDQLNISNFEEYTKQLPSVSFQTLQPGLTVVYMRGVATGGDGNHSGSLPSVGTYLDEQPVTTIGGTLDIHIYDIARIESLAGPQGTLYGASSEAGTIRIITNKPELGVVAGRVDVEGNSVSHGGVGGKIEGMINLPVGDHVAFRGVAFAQHDAGYIDNIASSRTYCGDPVTIPDPDDATSTITVGCVKNGITVNNNNLVKKNFNDQNLYGGRAALKIDLNDNWTVTPTIFHQNLKANGNFSFDPKLGDLNTDRFFEEVRKDKFTQGALTIEGKIANFDITFAGAYLDRKTYTTSDYTDYTDTYDALYESYGGISNYFFFQDAAGATIDPRQHIIATDHFKKFSQELRVASPADKPFRIIAGAFYQNQSNLIHQDYRVDNLGPLLSVNGFPGTLWLTQQKRVDKDYALFGEASFDVTPKITLTAGGRVFKYDNSLIGFFGFGRNPTNGFSDFPPNAAVSNRTGVAQCFTTSGERLYDRDTNTYSSSLVLLPPVVDGSPCTNLGEFRNGKVVPKRAKGSGFTHRLNATWKPNEDMLFYGTWSRGFRPGGINRRSTVPAYAPDFLNNFEFGWKTTWANGHLRWNGAAYHQVWKAFQFAFLGPNSFTEIHNGSDATINGIETDVGYNMRGFSLNASAAYTDAKTKANICTIFADTASDCSGVVDGNQDYISAPKGTRLPITPHFKGAVTARYAWPVMTNAKAHVQGALSYQGSAPSSLRSAITLVGTYEIVNPRQFQGKLHAFALADFAAGIDWPKFDVEAFVQNAFDKRNELSRFVQCGSCMRTYVVPGQPRTIGVRAGMKF